MKENIVCYYHNDLDGIFAASVVDRFYKNTVNLTLRNIDHYNDNLNEKISDVDNFDRCIIVDFSFPSDIMTSLFLRFGKNLIWIDHHITAKEKNPELWDNKKLQGLRSTNWSGCYLTWIFYYGDIAPTVIQLVDDMDRWIWQYKESKSFVEYADIVIKHPLDVSQYFTFEDEDDEPDKWIDQFCDYGSVLLAKKQKQVERIFNTGINGTFKELKTRFINTSSSISDVGAFCCEEKGYDLAFIWHVQDSGVIVSLRSKGDQAAEIAKEFNGGGHPKASGFIIKQLSKMLEMLPK